MITVMFLESRLGIGGSEMMWANLIERLDRRRFRPLLCCLYEPGPLGERLKRAGVPVYHHLARQRWDVRVFQRLLRLLRQECVDAIYMINQPLTQFWGTLCGKVARIPVLVTSIHSTGKINRIHRRKWMNRLTFRFMHRVTALSEAHKAYLTEKEEIEPDKIEIIPNGIEVNQYLAQPDAARLRGSLGISGADSIVGIVAMLRPEKAHEIFLQAAARILQQIPKTRFLVVGDGPERARLEAFAKKLGIESRVSFLGLRNDVPTLVNLFDVAALSSRPVVETLSVSVLEYLAAGKPVVATRVGSLPELIEDGKNGFLVEPGDSEVFAECVVRLLRDPSLARQMGAVGRQKVMEKYTLDQMLQRTESLFEKLLNGRVK